VTTLQTALDIIRWIHIPAGLIGLAVFWLPLVVKKGGRVHRRAGWVFVYSMAIASVTAVALAVLRALIFRERTGSLTLEGLAGPLFLVNVAMLTGVSVYHGIAVLRQKSRTTAGTGPLDLGLPIALVAISILTLALGFVTRNPVLFTLPVVGLIIGTQQFIAARRAPTNRMWWWFEHMAGMLGGCIAALTATLITNAKYIRPYATAPDWLFWIGPALIGIPLLLLWQRAYRRRFAAAGQARQPS
jgi:hypothetical protein